MNGYKLWVVHITSWGTGEKAVVDYFARYTFRVTLTNHRLAELDKQTVGMAG